MSRDLTLLIVDKDVNTSFTMLDCQTNCYDLFEDLEKELNKETLKSIDFVHSLVTGEKTGRGLIPEGFSCYKARIPDGSYKGESCFGEVDTDSLGTPLRYLTVSILLEYKKHPGVLRNKTHLAAWDYLEQLDRDTKVVLFWS